MSTEEEAPAPSSGTTDAETQEALKAVFAYGANLMASGSSPAEIEDKLVERGLGREPARIVVGKLSEIRSQARAKAGSRNMAIGAAWCIGGVVVTAVTYSAASEGGGTYIVTWGAIIFGAVQFFRGLAQRAG
jgi:hypothetical protein